MLKQVIVVDTSLNMPVGKLAAQVAHASIAAFLDSDETIQLRWKDAGMPKIVLATSGEQNLIELLQNAKTKELPCALIRDAGRTVLKSGTASALGIGPAENDEIDRLTCRLTLL